MTTITISHKTSFSELLAAFFLIQVLAIAKAVKAAYMAYLGVKSWLQSKHNFTPGEDDPTERVELTGWQYLGVGFLTIIFALIVSIDWERAF